MYAAQKEARLPCIPCRTPSVEELIELVRDLHELQGYVPWLVDKTHGRQSA